MAPVLICTSYQLRLDETNENRDGVAREYIYRGEVHKGGVWAAMMAFALGASSSTSIQAQVLYVRNRNTMLRNVTHESLDLLFPHPRSFSGRSLSLLPSLVPILGCSPLTVKVVLLRAGPSIPSLPCKRIEPGMARAGEGTGREGQGQGSSSQHVTLQSIFCSWRYPLSAHSQDCIQ
ncbi:hypothetical protein VTK73DRAFT_5727 [Phialemonium thermophilum]|uniref:Uncharacterized protein n=1 Tax=Phialemonium thermophilum TaxID=223376 RepID=A0ABR3XY94_9PEZI